MKKVYCSKCKYYTTGGSVCCKCGGKLSEDPATLGMIAVGTVILIIIGYYVYNAIANPKPSQDTTITTKTTNTSDYKVEAKVCAEMEVEKMLKSPSTAKFQTASANSIVTTTGQNQYIVTSYVDAQNSFGAVTRQNFKCTVQYNPVTIGCVTECAFE